MTRIIFFFSRTRAYSFLSHLDMLRLFIRALRRSGLPLDYSKGFNPHLRLTLALPLPVGVSASNEPAEVYLSEFVSPSLFEKTLGDQLPKEVSVFNSFIPDENVPGPASLVEAALYKAVLRDIPERLAEETIDQALLKLLEKQEINYFRENRKKKGRQKAINVRPYVIEALPDRDKTGLSAIKLLLAAGSRGGVSPAFILDQLAQISDLKSLKARCWLLHRKGLYYRANGQLRPFLKGYDCDG